MTATFGESMLRPLSSYNTRVVTSKNNSPLSIKKINKNVFRVYFEDYAVS